MKDFSRPWAKGLRGLILKHLNERGPMTTHEAADFCQVSVDAAAPRFSELEAEGLIRDTGERRSPISGRGRKQKVWCAAGEDVSDCADHQTHSLL